MNNYNQAQTQKLSGLHALVCPRLVDTGFKVFTKDRITLICSVTSSLCKTYPSANTNLAIKKADGLLPLVLIFPALGGLNYSFLITLEGDEVFGRWASNKDKEYSEPLPVWEAVQEFELRHR